MKTKQFGEFSASCLNHRLYFVLPFLGVPRVRSPLRAAALDFNICRTNGAANDHPTSGHNPPSYDEKCDAVWTKGEFKKDDYVYGVKEADGYYHYELRYYPATTVLLWFEEMDRNYILRLKREGTLLADEPHLDRDLAEYKDPHDKPRQHAFHDEIMRLFHQAHTEKAEKERDEKHAREIAKQKVEQKAREEAEDQQRPSGSGSLTPLHPTPEPPLRVGGADRVDLTLFRAAQKVGADVEKIEVRAQAEMDIWVEMDIYRPSPLG